MEKISDIEEKVANIKIDSLESEYEFKTSKMYYVKLIILYAIVLFCIISNKKDHYTLAVGIFTMLIVISIYNLWKDRIIIKDNKLLFSKNVVDLKNLKTIKYKYTRIGGIRNSNYIEFVTKDDKTYKFMLNMKEKYYIIALIKKISGLKIGM